MPESIVTIHYSQANLFGWLSGRAEAVPTFSDLLVAANQPRLADRRVAIQKYDLFREHSIGGENWVSELLDAEFSALEQALAARLAGEPDQFLVDYIWLERWMPSIRQIVRRFAIDRRAETSSVETIFKVITSQVVVPDALEPFFEQALADAAQRRPNQTVSLAELEIALDQAVLAIQVSHLDSTKSAGLRQWILLQTLLEWAKQLARFATLGLPAPDWQTWFPADRVPAVCEDPKTLEESLWSNLAGGAEWAIQPALFDENYVLQTDPVTVEQETLQVLSDFLNQVEYIDDMPLFTLRFAWKLRRAVETAASILASSLPSAEKIEATNPNYDL